MNVLGFPCNQFGGQEPGTKAEILEFVTSTYDVDFPMYSKIEVNGEKEAELYTIMKAAQPGDGDDPSIKWNFEKFLVDPDAHVIARWDTGTTPEEVRAQLPSLM